jgi:hypothetical protein
MRGWTSRRSETTDLESVVREIAGIVKRYGLSTVIVLWDDFRKGWGQDNPDLLVSPGRARPRA